VRLLLVLALMSHYPFVRAPTSSSVCSPFAGEGADGPCGVMFPNKEMFCTC
jgi:hypothetical protein